MNKLLCGALALLALVSLTVSSPVLASTSLFDSQADSPALAVTTTVNPVADAYVDSSFASTNYGASTQVRVDGSPTVRGYLRFNVAGVSGAVSQATLVIYANSNLSTGITANRVADNTWGETTITYGNAPAVGTAIGTSSAVTAGTWVSINVTPYVTGNGTFSFALTSGNATALSLASREAANKPQLVVMTATSPTATAVAPTATTVPATATKIPATATTVPATATTVPATATMAPATATAVAPTATKIPATATMAPPTATPASTGSGITLNPIADAYVDSSYPSTNHGASKQVRVDGSPTVRGYLRFNVAGLSGAASNATLRLYANSSLSTGITANRVADNAWGEMTINYGNSPAVGSAIGTSGVATTGAWISFDVTSYVTGNGTFSFALTSGNVTALSLASREAANKPQLIVTTGSGTLPTATKPPPTATAVGPTATKVPATATPVGPIATKVPPTATPVPPTATPPPSGGDPIVLATGDSRSGCNAGATATANLLAKYSASTLLLFNGDATDTGASSEFTNCFNTTFGKYKAQIRPEPGNHEYNTAGASGYYGYYGTQAKPQGQSYYSFDIGTWHIVALNSEIDISATSAQIAWLKNDLTAHPTQCTLTYWHEPRWSSGNHGNNTFVSAVWQTLYDHNVDVVFNGHDHDYERFAPQNPSGAADNARGIREFVIGTAGAPPYSFATIRANSQVRMTGSYGLVQFTLHPSSYDWKFVPTSGSFADSGTTACH